MPEKRGVSLFFSLYNDKLTLVLCLCNKPFKGLARYQTSMKNLSKIRETSAQNAILQVGLEGLRQVVAVGGKTFG